MAHKTLKALPRLKNSVLMNGAMEGGLLRHVQHSTASTQGTDAALVIVLTFQMWHVLWVPWT